MNKRQGFVLFTVVILLLLLTIITISAMQMGMLEERTSRNRYESEKAFLNGENVASKVGACFSGKTNDICHKPLFSWFQNTQDKTLENMFSDRPQVYRLTTDQVYHYLVPHPKPRIIFPLPSMAGAKQTKESLLPALATDIPIAIWRNSPNKASNPDRQITTDFLKNSCPAMSTCITNTFYMPRGYTLLAGGNIKLDNQSNNNQGNAKDNPNSNQPNPGGTHDPTQGSNPSTLNLKAYPWLAAFSPMNHRFDFPTLAALHLAVNEPTSSSPNATTSPVSGNATGVAGSAGNASRAANTPKGPGAGQSAPPSSSSGKIIGSIHAQKDIDLGNMDVEGFGTAGGKISQQTKQIQLKTWDKGNCKDCFADLDITLEPKSFKKQIDNYVSLLKNDKSYHKQCSFGGSGGASDPSTGQQGQGVKSLDLGGAIYYCDGDVTIAADVDPKNGTIVATGDIVVEALPSGFCPNDQPVVGQFVDAAVSAAYLVQASLPLIQDAANLLATTMASGAAGVAATPVTAAAGAAAGAAAVPATAAAGAAVGAAAAPVAGAAAGAAVVGTTGAAAGTVVPVAGNVAGAAAGTATGATAGAAAGTAAAPVTGAAGAAAGAAAAPVAGAAAGAAAPLASAAAGAAASGLQWIQDGAQAFKAGTATLSELCSLGRSLLTSLQQKNNPRNKQPQNQQNSDGTPASDTLNLIAAGNITLRRNIFGTLTAAGDIAVADNISIVYPQAPEKAQLAAWRRDYHLQDQKP